MAVLSIESKRTKAVDLNLIHQLCDGIQNAQCISLAVGESTDNAQLLVFVSFYDEAKGEFVEDVLGLTNLSGHTRGKTFIKQ